MATAVLQESAHGQQKKAENLGNGSYYTRNTQASVRQIVSPQKPMQKHYQVTSLNEHRKLTALITVFITNPNDFTSGPSAAV